MTALDKIKKITAFLKKCGIEDAGKESEIILTHSLRIDKVVLYRDNPVLSDEDTKEIDRILARRAKREPLQYILGYVEFYGLKIKVGPGVLIPRPETELLVEEVIKAVTVQKLPPHPPLGKGGTKEGLNILDLCTGSGCLALAIAKHLPESTVYGTDISKTAIGYAHENAEINNVRNVSFLKGSLFEPVAGLTFDVIVSNPPYIKSNDIANLQPEIKSWEPRNALDGGEDGLRYYNGILSDARKHLKMGGYVFLEIGEGQAEDVAEIARANHFKIVSVIKDYAGIERIVSMTC